MQRRRRDFSTDGRLLLLCVIAVAIGGLSTVAAWTLLNLIHFFTSLFFFQTLSFADRSPATHHLGALIFLVPAPGILIVGLMARYGSVKIRGHGILEAMELLLRARRIASVTMRSVFSARPGRCQTRPCLATVRHPSSVYILMPDIFWLE